jgi:hypothetical protein
MAADRETGGLVGGLLQKGFLILVVRMILP